MLVTSDSSLRYDFADALLPQPVVPQPALSQPQRVRREPLLPPIWIPTQRVAGQVEPTDERPSRLARHAILPPMWIPAQAVLAPPLPPPSPAAPLLPNLLLRVPAESVPALSVPPLSLALDAAPANRSSSRSVFRFMPVLVLSLVVHLLAMIILAKLNLAPQTDSLVTILAAAFTQEEPLVEDVIEVIEVTPAPLEDIEPIIADPGSGEELVAAEIEVGDEMAAGPMASELGVDVADVSEIDGLFSGLGEGTQNAGRGRPQPYVAQFFGVKAVGRKFVFVVDNSGSMSGEKFAATKRELAYAISRLSREQSFYVIFFNSEAQKMVLAPDEEPPTNVVPATVPNIKKLSKWMETVETAGGTDPYDAVEFAMSIKPDAIFILSDGQFSDGGRTLQFLDNANVLYDPAIGYQTRVNIHTIAFWDRGGEETMKEIARLHKGTHRFVPPRRAK